MSYTRAGSSANRSLLIAESTRRFRRLLKRGIGPKPAMHAFAREIANTASSRLSVGNKLLAFSIPRGSATDVSIR